MSELDKYFGLEKFQTSYPNIVPTLDSLRWMVRQRDKNGLSACGAVVKRGGRWYVHSGRFSEWMFNGNGQRQEKSVA